MEGIWNPLAFPLDPPLSYSKKTFKGLIKKGEKVWKKLKR